MFSRIHLFISVFALLLTCIAMGARPTYETRSTAGNPTFPNFSRVITNDTAETAPQPQTFKYAVGYEATGTSTSVLGQNAVSLSAWFTDQLGFEGYLGYTKAADSYSETNVDTINALTNARTVQLTYGGTRNPHTFTLGGVLKYRVFQNRYFQLYGAAMLVITPMRNTVYATGVRTETIPDNTNPGNKSVTETAVGTVNDETSLMLSLGPKIGAEFYLPWFNHLALGFATGILTSFGGGTKSTRNTRTQTYAVINNVNQAPSADSNTSNVTDTPLGMRGTTFGIGGTNFQFTGIFSLRYCW